MAVRTTVDQVAAILAPGNDWDGKSELAPFIEAASAQVDFIVANASKYGRTALSTAQQELVERWLAAALLKMSDQQLASSVAGRSSGQFRGTSADGLCSNKYGETACLLDTSRMHKPISEGRIASAAWTGKSVPDQIDYKDRN